MAVATENNQSVPGGYAIKNQQYYKEMGMRRDGEEMLQTRSTELQIRIAKECCLLYDGAESACWACGPGWDGPLEKLSYKLEALNVQLFDRWKVRVIAAQVKEKFGTLRFYFDCLVDGNGEPTREQLVLSRYVEDLASEYVRKAEEECYGVCEECGTSIGSSESPRCCTLGWCRYLCRDCAMRHEEGFPPVRYEMDGKFYEGEKEIPSPFKSKGERQGQALECGPRLAPQLDSSTLGASPMRHSKCLPGTCCPVSYSNTRQSFNPEYCRLVQRRAI